MKVFLAGTYSESKNVDDLLESPYILESFYYIAPWQYELIHKTKMFLLDSGAFTLFNVNHNTDWNEYIEKYAQLINEQDVQYFFELDIDKLIGYEKVKQLRKKLERLTNKQCMPVWHRSRGIQEYYRLCDEYNYIAIGGLAIKDIKPKEYGALPVLINEAHKRNTQVHGLGFTNVKRFKDIRFDSVDSTRWNCARFGRLEYFNGETIVSIDKRKQGKRLQDGINNEIIKFTFQEWIKFQKYADEYL